MTDVGAFGARLRELREAAGLTQEQLAERTGVKRDAVARWERGNREPSWGNVVSLCEALGVSCEAFRQPTSAEAATPKRGRPRKAPAEAPEPGPGRGGKARQRGRNAKDG